MVEFVQIDKMILIGMEVEKSQTTNPIIRKKRFTYLNNNHHIKLKQLLSNIIGETNKIICIFIRFCGNLQKFLEHSSS